MKQSVRTIFLFLFAWFSLLMGAAVPVVDGVSRELAVYRTAHISNVCYDLSFTVPVEKSSPVGFEELLTFNWTGECDLQIDFQGDVSQLYNELMVNGKTVKTVLLNEHIIIPTTCIPCLCLIMPAAYSRALTSLI